MHCSFVEDNDRSASEWICDWLTVELTAVVASRLVVLELEVLAVRDASNGVSFKIRVTPEVFDGSEPSV